MTHSAALDLEVVEQQRRAVQVEIDAAVSPTERNRVGQFATPPELARSIARCASGLLDLDHPIHFCDPALGTGAFFHALLTELPRGRIATATGIEVQETIARAAKTLWEPFGLRVVQGDFAEPGTVKNLPRPNLILTNPPYVRHHHLGQERKQHLKREILRSLNLRVSGLSGFYLYYLLLATEWMQDDGLAVWLIPSEFMEVNYGGALREYLTTHTDLLRVHRFDPHEVQFEDALVSSAVVFLRKKMADRDASVSFTFGGTIEHPRVQETVVIEQLRREKKWTQHPAQGAVHARLADDPCLGDFFTIRRGVATGANEFFIIPRQDAKARGVPLEQTKPVLPSPRRLPEMVIRADAHGYPLVEPQLVVIDCRLQEDVLRAQYPQLWTYFESAEGLGLRNRYLLRKRDPWYRQEDREPPPFLCTYMGRKSSNRPLFRFIWNQSRAIATNLYLLMYPKGPLKKVLAERPDLQGAVFEALNEIDGEVLRRAGRVYGGGLQKLEPTELSQAPADELLTRLPELRDRLVPQFALDGLG